VKRAPRPDVSSDGWHVPDVRKGVAERRATLETQSPAHHALRGSSGRATRRQPDSGIAGRTPAGTRRWYDSLTVHECGRTLNRPVRSEPKSIFTSRSAYIDAGNDPQANPVLTIVSCHREAPRWARRPNGTCPAAATKNAACSSKLWDFQRAW